MVNKRSLSSKLFLNVDLGHEHFDEQRKLLKTFRIIKLKHRLFVSFVKLIYRIFNDKDAVEIVSRIVLSQPPAVSQHFIKPVIKNDTYNSMNFSFILSSFIRWSFIPYIIQSNLGVVALFSVKNRTSEKNLKYRIFSNTTL